MARVTKLNVQLTASSKGLSAGIAKANSALDRLTKHAMMTRAALGNIGTGISKLTGTIGAGMSKFGSIASTSLSRVGIAATGAAAGIAYLTKTSIDAIGDANDFAKSIGISYNGLRSIQKAAQMSGVSLETTNGALMKMSDTLGTAFGGNQAAIDSFEKIGLDIEKLKQLRPEQQFLAIAQAIDKIKDPAAKVAAARDIFGRSGGLLISFFGGAGETIADAQKALDLFGVSLSQIDVERIDEAGDAMGEFGFIVEGVGNQLAKSVAPYITQISKDTMAWLESMGGIDDIVSGGLTKMGGAIQTILDKMVYVQAAWRLVKDVVESVVGVFDMLPESIKKLIKVAATWNPVRDALIGDIEKHAEDIRKENGGNGGIANKMGAWGRGALGAQEQAAQDRVQSDHDARRDARIEAERNQIRQSVEQRRAAQAPSLSTGDAAQQRYQNAPGRERSWFERNGIADPRMAPMMNSAPMSNQQQAGGTAGSEDINLLRQIAINTGKNTIGFAGA